MRRLADVLLQVGQAAGLAAVGRLGSGAPDPGSADGLSHREERVVVAVPGLAALGWDEGWASALAELSDSALLPARVSRVDRGVTCFGEVGTE